MVEEFLLFSCWPVESLILFEDNYKKGKNMCTLKAGLQPKENRLGSSSKKQVAKTGIKSSVKILVTRESGLNVKLWAAWVGS